MIVSSPLNRPALPCRPVSRCPVSRAALLVLLASASLAFVGTGVACAQAIAARAMEAPPGAPASGDALRTLVASAVDAGVDTLILPVPLFPGDGDDARGPLAAAVRQAHARGVRVVASVDVMAAAGAGDMPLSRGHVLYSHPEWLMVPRGVAVELLKIDPRTPGYLGRLARWTRTHQDDVPALYLSPLDRDAAVFLTTAVRELVARYDLDGVQITRARFPGPDFDYSRHAIDLFRAERQLSLTMVERARIDQVEQIDPFAYLNEYPDEWQRFRRTRVTALVSDIEAAVRSVRASAVVSVVDDDSDGSHADPAAPILSSRRDAVAEVR